MFKGPFRPVDLVDSLIIPQILLSEHRAKEMHGVKGRLARATEFTLRFHLDSISSERLGDRTSYSGIPDNLQGMKTKRSHSSLFPSSWPLTFIPSHLSKIRCCSWLAPVSLGLLQSFRRLSRLLSKRSALQWSCQNWPGMCPSKNPTGRLCGSDIKVKINVSYSNQNTESEEVIGQIKPGCRVLPGVMK